MAAFKHAVKDLEKQGEGKGKMKETMLTQQRKSRLNFSFENRIISLYTFPLKHDAEGTYTIMNICKQKYVYLFKMQVILKIS